ncbi:hypothetical protein P7K49_024824 [Saguinus oedipus]|uniref:Uncharacterized protein n=1 Tax=Saguinus oedipus TaxID=9490 RepID=A0ABQ9UQN3_SAGOE|nr:hypothetical protein P7K49_024824 [Saguinus oedipus]
MVPVPSRESLPESAPDPRPSPSKTLPVLPLPLPQPHPFTYWSRARPSPTREGTGSVSMSQGCTPRERTHCPDRTRCGARAGPSLRAAGRTWGRPRQGRSPAACTPQRPLPAPVLAAHVSPRPVVWDQHRSVACAGSVRQPQSTWSTFRQTGPVRGARTNRGSGGGQRHNSPSGSSERPARPQQQVGFLSPTKRSQRGDR